MAYISLEDVEFLHDGHAAQQREQAAEPQQQASAAPIETTAPILVIEVYVITATYFRNGGGREFKEIRGLCFSSFFRFYSVVDSPIDWFGLVLAVPPGASTRHEQIPWC